MRIKSYFAESVEEAMDQARVELGSEAMLMDSKPTAPEFRHLGRYEVVFGLAFADIGPAAAQSAASALLPNGKPDTLAQEIADLRRQIDTVKRSMSRQTFHMRWTAPGTAPELAELYMRLLNADFTEETAHELVQSVETRMSRRASARTGSAPEASGKRHSPASWNRGLKPRPVSAWPARTGE